MFFITSLPAHTATTFCVSIADVTICSWVRAGAAAMQRVSCQSKQPGKFLACNAGRHCSG